MIELTLHEYFVNNSKEKRGKKLTFLKTKEDFYSSSFSFLTPFSIS